MHLIIATDAKDYAQDLSRRVCAAVKAPPSPQRDAVLRESAEYAMRRLASAVGEAEELQEMQHMIDDMTFYSDKPL